jgi:hypothetical protein
MRAFVVAGLVVFHAAEVFAAGQVVMTGRDYRISRQVCYRWLPAGTLTLFDRQVRS